MSAIPNESMSIFGSSGQETPKDASKEVSDFARKIMWNFEKSDGTFVMKSPLTAALAVFPSNQWAFPPFP